MPDRAALVISHRPVGLDEFDRILFLHDGCFTTVAPDEVRALLNADRNWGGGAGIAGAAGFAPA